MKVYMETLGCPKNFYDTETAKGIMIEEGIEIVNDPEDGDFIILNTCGFINDAKKESINRIFELSEYCNDDKKLVVSGCLSERYSKSLVEEMPEVDCFIGVNEYETLPQILKSLKEGKGGDLVTGKASCQLLRLPRLLEENPYTATLKIAEGCNNRCAYCVIPYIRGDYRSKRKEDIIEEAKWLASKGCVELILIAQDLTYYGVDLYGKQMLPELLRELCKIEGIQWIRLMYCYEDRITDELIDVIATEDKICNYIDIPLQHASDKILKAMNRRSTEKSIRETILKLKGRIPDIHIRTTFITGFPGEKAEDFQKLMEFVEVMQFQRLGVFPYSKEENTPAAKIRQVPEKVREERAECIMRCQLEISLAHNRDKIGHVLQVLVEERDQDGSYIGRSRYDAPEIDNSVIFTSERELKPGMIVRVKIDDAFDYDLVGTEV